VSVVVVGLNHHAAPMAILERMTVPAAGIEHALRSLHAANDIDEVVVLSTCNRTEVYAVCETFHGAVDAIHRFFADLSGLEIDQFGEYLQTSFEHGPVKHLFGVASGLDSAVVGETEILGQVRRAWDMAREAGTCGPNLSALFRHSLEAGKRARTETAIARGTASVSHAAVQLAASTLGGTLVGRSVLVLGTGEIGVSMVGALQNSGVNDVVVANRTRQKAVNLARRLGASYVGLDELGNTLERVDVLLTATSAVESVLHVDDVEAVMAARNGKPLLIVDTALPRDVEPDVAMIEGVTLLDMVGIRTFVEAGLEERRKEIDHVEAIVTEEVDRYQADAAARQAAPVIRALRNRVETLRKSEFDRYAARLTPREAELVDHATRQLMAKMLHEPTIALKSHAGTIKGQRIADALRLLFDLDDVAEPTDHPADHSDRALSTEL
jgi:glutamyl-tRNA reductase